MARQRGALISILWIINYIFAVAYVHCSGLSKLSAERLKAKQLPPCRFLLAASIDGSLSNDVPVAFSSKSQHRTDRFVNMYSDFSHWYRFYLERYPYRTNSITGALLAIFGDISAQVYTSFTHFDSSIQSETRFTRFLNLRRTASMAIVSGLFGSPITTWWFQFINLLPQFQGIGKLKKAIAMTLLDQSVGVVFITAGFFFFNAMVSLFLFPLTSHMLILLLECDRFIKF